MTQPTRQPTNIYRNNFGILTADILCINETTGHLYVAQSFGGNPVKSFSIDEKGQLNLIKNSRLPGDEVGAFVVDPVDGWCYCFYTKGDEQRLATYTPDLRVQSDGSLPITGGKVSGAVSDFENRRIYAYWSSEPEARLITVNATHHSFQGTTGLPKPYNSPGQVQGMTIDYERGTLYLGRPDLGAIIPVKLKDGPSPEAPIPNTADFEAIDLAMASESGNLFGVGPIPGQEGFPSRLGIHNILVGREHYSGVFSYSNLLLLAENYLYIVGDSGLYPVKFDGFEWCQKIELTNGLIEYDPMRNSVGVIDNIRNRIHLLNCYDNTPEIITLDFS